MFRRELSRYRVLRRECKILKLLPLQCCLLHIKGLNTKFTIPPFHSFLFLVSNEFSEDESTVQVVNQKHTTDKV